MKFKKTIVILATMIFSLSCSGKGAEVGTVVAVAATLTTIQKVRETKATNNGLRATSQGDCCVVCSECTFPCGDSCVANGTLCTRPNGCACTADKSIPKGTPRPEPNPINCNPQAHQIEL